MTLFPYTPSLLYYWHPTLLASTTSRKTAKKGLGHSLSPGHSFRRLLHSRLFTSTWCRTVSAIGCSPLPAPCSQLRNKRDNDMRVNYSSVSQSQVQKCALAERKLRSPERTVRAGADSPTMPARRSSWARAASWRWPRTSCGGQHGAREVRIRMKSNMVTPTCCVVQVVGSRGGCWCRFHLLPGDVADKDPVSLVVLVHQRVVAADHRLLHLLLRRRLATRRRGRVPLSCAIEKRNDETTDKQAYGHMHSTAPLFLEGGDA